MCWLKIKSKSELWSVVSYDVFKRKLEKKLMISFRTIQELKGEKGENILNNP